MMGSQETRPVADWGRVSAIYGQCLTCLSDESRFLPPALTGLLAEVISRVSSSYYGREELFISDAFDALTAGSSGRSARAYAELYSDNRFTRIPPYSLESDRGQRRRPTPFEAILETGRRLRDLARFDKALADAASGVILGGSTSYGRFFNVMGNREGKASDIDLLVVINDYDMLGEVVDGMAQVEGVSRESLGTLSSRVRSFQENVMAAEKRPTLFSAKLKMWDELGADSVHPDSEFDGRYHASLHIASETAFKWVTLDDSPTLDGQALGSSRAVYDFRETVASRLDHQRGFSGENVRLELDSGEVGGSVVRRSHVFHITDEGAYCPGMFQNLILPAFDVRLGTPAFRRRLDSFRWKMVERLRYERQRRPDQLLRLSLSHTRSEIFAPHTIRAVDSSTLVP